MRIRSVSDVFNDIYTFALSNADVYKGTELLATSKALRLLTKYYSKTLVGLHQSYAVGGMHKDEYYQHQAALASVYRSIYKSQLYDYESDEANKYVAIEYFSPTNRGFVRICT